MKSVIVIPARLHSTRLPEKVLLDLGGKPVVQWVYEACKKSRLAQEVWIAVDSEKVAAVCNSFCDKVVMTDPAHTSGTDRIAEVSARIDCDIVINVQGDEPFFEAETADRLIAALQDEHEVMASVYGEIASEEELNNPNLVKVITNATSHAIYFSRLPLPYNRDGQAIPFQQYKKHMGVYGYKSAFIQTFAKLPAGFLEQMEKLEQLRAIENGYSIKMIRAERFEKGIDTLEDLQMARKLIQQ